MLPVILSHFLSKGMIHLHTVCTYTPLVPAQVVLACSVLLPELRVPLTRGLPPSFREAHDSYQDVWANGPHKETIWNFQTGFITGKKL